MPLQNRVDPFSRIHAVDARGMFMGNRGILHDAETQTLRKQSWATDGWVICLTEYKGWKAPVMGNGTYTRLFFLDEAVALAAGHRPCFLCRRDAACAFREAAGMADAASLHRAINAEMKPLLRVRSAHERAACSPKNLPDCAMFGVDGTAYLKQGNVGRPFGWRGYGAAQPLPDVAQKLTPNVTLKALAAGYRPQLHPSAAKTPL